MRVLIVGNSNSGKTTLFNALTGSNQRTGNWHGVTVDKFSKTKSIFGKKIEFVDLPGVVALNESSLEEKVTISQINEEKFDLIINVVDINQFEFSIKLIKSLESYCAPVITIFNFYSEFLKRGGKVQNDQLLQAFFGNAIIGDVTDKTTLEKIKNKLVNEKIRKTNCDKNEAFKSIVFPEFKLTKIEKLFFSPLFLGLFFVFVLFFAFYLAFGEFGIGRALGAIIDEGLSFLILRLKLFFDRVKVSAFLSAVITDGILEGMKSVFIFLPQIAILQFVLICLEQSGLIARISFLTDGFLSKFGLCGKAVFALIMGFGCTALSIECAKGMDSLEMKKRFLIISPNVSCSAKVPVYLFFLSLVFKRFITLALLCVYLLSVIMTIFSLYINSKINKSKVEPLILEIPPLRKITFLKALKPLKKNINEFIIKVGTVVFLVSFAVFLLKSFTIDFKYASSGDISKSILAYIGSKISFLFAPIGLDKWEISTSLLSGIFAKEAIISTFCLTGAGAAEISLRQAVSLVLFILIYPPCLVALDGLRRELGFFKTILVFVYHLLLALVVSYLTYALFFAIKYIIFVAIMLVAIIIIIRKRKSENFYRFNKRKAFKNATKKL